LQVKLGRSKPQLSKLILDVKLTAPDASAAAYFATVISCDNFD
jgi:hypothetical protein